MGPLPFVKRSEMNEAQRSHFETKSMHQICETNLNDWNFSVVWNPVEMTGSCPWKFAKQGEYDRILRVKVWSHLQIFVKSRVYCQ